MTLDHHERGARHQSVCASEAVLTDGRIRRALQVCSVRLRVASTEQHGRWLETNRWTQAELPTLHHKQGISWIPSRSYRL
jgi:hypothetical protein